MDSNRRKFHQEIWPNIKPTKIDKITPHKIIVLFLVRIYVEDIKDVDKPETHPNFSKGFCMLLLKLIQYPDMSYIDLKNLLSSRSICIDPIYLFRFEEFMETIPFDGPEILFTLQKYMGDLLTDNVHVNQFSIVGFYIRRILLALNKMGFENMSDLYENLVAYYKKVRLLDFEPDNGEVEFSMLDSPPPSYEPPIHDGHSKWSVKQADLFIAQQCNLLENNEIHAIKPIDLQKILNEIIEDVPMCTQAHKLTYLNHLRVRDFFKSLDSYHRAYDQHLAHDVDSAGSDSNPSSNAAQSKNANKGLQYSSLNLAIMHMKFGHYNKALSNLRECITLAQEADDKPCLKVAQVMLWLWNKTDDIFWKTNLENTSIHSVSMRRHCLINFGASSGGTPSNVIELIGNNEVFNFVNSLMDMVANTYSQKAEVWQLYGKAEIASLYNQMLLQIIGSSKDSDCTENSEAVCMSLCSIALWLSLQGEHVLSAMVIQHTSARFPRDPLSRNWQLTKAHIRSQQAIHRCQWTEGQRACDQIRNYNSVLCELQQATLNISRGNGSAAYKQLQNLLNDDELEPIYRVRVMILMSNTCVRNELTVSAEKRFSAEAMGILNEASVYAQENFLSYEAAIVDLHTTYILLLMGMPQQALKLIRNCLETILANGGIYDCTRTQFLFVRCLIAAQGDNSEKINKLSAALTILEECILNFMKLEAYAKVKDIYIYLSTFYDSVGHVAERNKWACKFRRLNEQYPTPTEYLNIFL